MAAITGVGTSAKVETAACSRLAIRYRAMFLVASEGPPGREARSDTSIPAVNDGPRPATTIARTASSSSSRRQAAGRSSHRSAERALWDSGRSIQIQPIPSSIRTSRCS